MRSVTAAALAVFALAACDSRSGEESARTVDAADTTITSTQDVDTTIVTQDTSVDVDTVQKDADDASSRDTLQAPSGAEADTSR